MGSDATTVEGFYATPQGAVALRLVQERLAVLWPELGGRTVLGLGHAGPYLEPWQGAAARCVSAVLPPGLGGRFPSTGPSLTCAATESLLPLPGECMDRVLLVHGLECAENARRLLREAWRVLRDDGRLLVVAPNRVGLWAHSEGTPFGQGQPYSPGQLGRLLAASLFRVERRDTALFMPPIAHHLVLRTAGVWERLGRRLAPRLSGLTLMEAVKDVYSAVPVGSTSRRRLVFAEAG